MLRNNKENDWHKSAAREFSFFTTHEAVKGYQNMHKKYGHSFYNVLFHVEDEVLTLIRKKSETKTLLDYIESLSEDYIVKQLNEAVKLNKELGQYLKGLELNTKTWGKLVSLSEELWPYYMFGVYFGYATERTKIKKICDKHYNLVVEARNEINDLQVLEDFLRNYFPKTDLTELTSDEIAIFLKKSILPSKRELEERRKEYLLITKDLKLSRIPAANIKKTILKYLPKENYDGIKEVRGIPVFKGNVSGPVRIVSKRKNLPNIQEGDILVTIMTNPEFVPYLPKVKGIVTDYGGITCHASIISREMKIPCVVGTKIATKVLKDGDLVEVDANKGIVKIINKK